MAVILELVKSDISLQDIFNWLTTATANQVIENVFKNHPTCQKEAFPVLLATFIRDQSSRFLKLHNVGPIETNFSPLPNRRDSPARSAEYLLSPTFPTSHRMKSPGVHQEMRAIRRITPQKLDLQNESAFPPLSPVSSNREVPKKRRINPTQLSVETNTSPRVAIQFSSSPRNSPLPGSNNPFNQAKEQAGQKNLDQERALLKERKQQCIVTTPTSNDQATTVQLPKSWSCVEPNRSAVTKILELDRLSSLWSFCLSHHLSPALYGEIKLLLELLLLRICNDRFQQPKEDQTEGLLLYSVHNCVYFAAATLEKLESLWSHLDRYLVQLLAGSARLAAFSPELAHRLGELARTGATLPEKKRLPSRTVANVSFQSDTDNRLNFASDASFQTFRKQRDIFCEAWQIWKANWATPGWSMAAALQRMIHSLVDMRRDCVNYAHLARLFRSQLLDVAQLVVNVQEETETFGPLGLLQSSDPDKLRRLRERLVNPPLESRSRSSSTVLGDRLTEFDGDQEFFRDFILLANSPAFNEHLKISLASGIEEFSVAEDCDDPSRFAETVVALQVMAKFLAFLTFLPHACGGDRLPENVFHHLIQLRSSQLSSNCIDLLAHLSNAFHSGRLLLTVPWLVVYLSLADSVSLGLPSCRAVLSCCVYIYRRAELCPINGFFIRLLLSWLFDQPNFPRALLTQRDDELCSQLQVPFKAVDDHDPADSARRLDRCPFLVDSTLLYQCCPCLWTWRQLLTDFASSDQHRPAVGRKITPIAAGDEPSPAKPSRPSSTVKSLQVLLRENFFHNQPSSVKRTVDFVAERLASNIVRDIRHQIIPGLAAEALAVLKSWASGQQNSGQDGRIDELSRKLCDRVKQEAALRANPDCTFLDGTLLSALLPNDMLPTVRKVCAAIVAQEIREKVSDWINLHVTVGLFKNDLLVEWVKVDKGQPQRGATSLFDPCVPSGPELAEMHDAATWAPSQLIDQFKKYIRQVIRDVSKLTKEDAKVLLLQAEGTLQRRKDVTPAVSKCFQQLSFDLLFILCVFQPENLDTEVIAAWVDFWRRTYPVDPASPTTDECAEAAPSSGSSSSSAACWLVFAPKQLLLLAQSVSPRESWSHITVLVLQLMKSGLVSYKHVQEQAVAVVRQEWPQEVLGRFGTCVRDIVDSQKRSDAETTTDEELLSWLSWFCAQDDLI